MKVAIIIDFKQEGKSPENMIQKYIKDMRKRKLFIQENTTVKGSNCTILRFAEKPIPFPEKETE